MISSALGDRLEGGVPLVRRSAAPSGFERGKRGMPDLESGDRIRVLHLVLQLSLGGAESIVALHATHLDRARYDVEVWALDTGGENVDRIRRSGVPVRVLSKGRGFRREFLATLRRDLHRGAFHVVHAHNAPAARWALVGVAASARRPVLVRTEHTYRGSRALGYLLGHALSGAWFDAIVGVSASTTLRHRRLDPLWRGRYLTIPNGIETEGGREVPEPARELRSRVGLPSEGRLLVNLGNLRQPKGQKFLLEAFRDLAGRYPDLRLLVLGEGPLRAAFERTCASWGLEDRVRLAGHRSDAPDLLAAADVFVQSSVREGMPVSVLEAARVCRPIVATDVGGTREFVRDGETGLLVAPGSGERLASAVSRLLDDRPLASRLALQARDHLRANFDIRQTVARTQALYERLLARRGVRPPRRDPGSRRGV